MMSEAASDGLWINSNLFTENHNRFPPDEYLRHAGKVIAWTLDGTRILASGTDELEVAEQLRQAGMNTWQVVFERVPDSDTIW